MKINNQTQLQSDLNRIQTAINKTEDAVAIAIDLLNQAHKEFWAFPDDRLEAILQQLHNDNSLNDLFTNHSDYAVDLNSLAENHTNIVKRAIVGANREFTISDDIVTLTPESVDPLPEEPTDSPDIDSPDV
tara:strand:+ start:1876 stop:2268 length:393 start_codon:yes stop_codon:yes gene_type:complete